MSWFLHTSASFNGDRQNQSPGTTENIRLTNKLKIEPIPFNEIGKMENFVGDR